MIDDIEPLIAGSSAQEVLALLASLDEKARRTHAELVRLAFGHYHAALFSPEASKAARQWQDPDALKVAMLATATRAELKPYGLQIIPQSPPLVDIMRALAPSWIDGWVEDLLERSPFIAGRLAPLWREGLCRRPDGDARILGYYNQYRGPELANHREFIEEDVWRFFEVEGGGDLSLAAHDKYCKLPESWSSQLLTLTRAGKLDRQRMLDASLDALERDFGQFRAGWYSRFHTALEPDLEEQAARCDRYLHLLASAVPPTVSMALKALKTLDKAGRLPVDDLLNSIQPALLSRQKSAALDALQLLGSAAKRAPSRATEIAMAALDALVSETADVQEKAIDLVDRLGQAGMPDVQAVLAQYRDVVAPSARARISAMFGQADESTPGKPESDAGPADTVTFPPLVPFASPEDALSGLLAVLEDPRDPLAVERVVDGVSRFGTIAGCGSTMLSPLAKRSGQILEKMSYQQIKRALAALGRAWSEDGVPSDVLREASGGFSGIRPDSLAATYLERCDEIAARLRSGHALPLLSLPSDRSGQVAPRDLVARLADYRAAGVLPGTVDLVLALLRLAREGREHELDRVDRSDDVGRSVAFALGEGEAAGGDGPLWAAAWLARADENGEVPVRWTSRQCEPDAGVAAHYSLIVEKTVSGGHAWCDPGVEITPPLSSPDPRMPGSLLHHRTRSSWRISGAAVGSEVADIAWASLVRPGNPESFFANGISALDPSQKLADHSCIAYLDAFERLDREPGPMGYAVLAFYLASEDGALCAHTVDKLSRLVARRHISAAAAASAILPFLLVGTFPSMRWTRNLATVASATPVHRDFVRDVLTGLMRFDPAQPPRDIGGMIELLYQLQLDSGAPLDDPAAIALLQSLEGGGKSAKFAKKLLALQGG